MSKGKAVPAGAMKSKRSRGERLIIPNTITRRRQFVILIPAVLPREVKLQLLMYSMLGGLQKCPDDLVNISYSSQESNHQTAA
jgi:hypothetical protein